MTFHETTVEKILNILFLITQNLIKNSQNTIAKMDDPFNLSKMDEKLKHIENLVLPRNEIQRRIELNSNKDFYNENQPRAEPKTSPISPTRENILDDKENVVPFPTHAQPFQKGYSIRRRSRLLERRNISPKTLDFSIN
jgi:hypothetical protein